MYLPQLACCACKPPPYVVCQLRRRVESCTVIRVCEESVVVDLYMEICICWVIRGWGGVSLDAARCGTVGISAVLGRRRSPDTACAWGRNSSVYPRGCPSIRGSPLGPVHCHRCFPRVCVRHRRAVGVVVTPARMAAERCGPQSPCPPVVRFGLHAPMWAWLVPGWAPCPRPELGHEPSSLVLGRGGCVGVVFGGSSCVVTVVSSYVRFGRRFLCFPGGCCSSQWAVLWCLLGVG